MSKTRKAEMLMAFRELFNHFEILDNFTGQPMAETLKALQQGFMDSDIPGALPRDELAAINTNFWALYQTARHIDDLPNPSGFKTEIIAFIDESIARYSSPAGGSSPTPDDPGQG